MPRRHKPTIHTRFEPAIHEGGKTPYPTKIMAERAAELRMLQNPSLELNVYQASDGKWYLTRQNPDTR